jgi:tetratricopeptide (TPR) repeat protein
LELSPRDAEVWFNRGNAKMELKDYEGALGDFNKATELFPRLAMSYYQRGIIYGTLKNYSAAEEEFNKAIDIWKTIPKAFPLYSRAYYQKGLVKIELNDRQGACVDFTFAKQGGIYKAEVALKEYCGK